MRSNVCEQNGNHDAALLSIKPKYADLILSGKKRFEFRKVPLKETIDYILLYASSPKQAIVGYMEIDDILESKPKELWESTHKYAGITFEEFSEYFKGKKLAYAFQIKKAYRFKNSIDPQDVFSNFLAPQSFRYIHTSVIQALVDEQR